MQAEFRGKVMPFTYTVTAFEQDSRIVLDGVGEKATSLDTIAFEATGSGGTRITYSADFKLKGALRVAEPFLGGTFRKLARHALDGLSRSSGRVGAGSAVRAGLRRLRVAIFDP